MLGSNHASLHKHPCPLPKQFKHVDAAAQEAGKTNKVVTCPKIQRQAISKQLFASGDVLYCEFCQYNVNLKRAVCLETICGLKPMWKN